MRAEQQELLRRRQAALQLGGTDAVAAQHKAGKLTARERLALLFDQGSMEELNLFARHSCRDFGMDAAEIPADGVITCFGKVNGRLVYAYAQDFTSMGGSVGEVHGRKIIRLQQEACRAGAPIVALCDSGGARIQEGVSPQIYAAIMEQNVLASGRIPQVAAIMGPCAGGAAYSPALCDHVIMVDRTAKLFLTGPKVVRKVTGENVDESYYGSGWMHNSQSGVAHDLAASDEDCIERIRLFLSYFPQNCKLPPPRYLCSQDPDALVPALDTILPEDPSRPYDMHEVVQLIFDRESLYEIQPLWAKNIITTLARLDGRPVGVVANNPLCKGGALDTDASDKAAHFIQLCDAFNLPLIYLADTPGFLPGTQQEYGGVIRHGAKMIYANSIATVPKIRLTIRKLYGGAAAAMCDSGQSPDHTISWPSAQEAVMGAQSAVPILFKKELYASDDPEALRAEKQKEFEDLFYNPYYKAQRMLTEFVIEPNETRRLLIRLLEAQAHKEVHHPEKKHAICPC